MQCEFATQQPREEVWRLCTAAGLDAKGELEQLMGRMARIGEKAIPLVTVAA